MKSKKYILELFKYGLIPFLYINIYIYIYLLIGRLWFSLKICSNGIIILEVQVLILIFSFHSSLSS